jgi:hypothetical protein
MSSNPDNPLAPGSGSVPSEAEETLRLIARLPSPVGLENRVHAALRYASSNRGWRRQIFVTGGAGPGRILAWPRSNWMRTAAAAAIVFVVAGGGWGVYTRVQRGQMSQPVKMIAVPRAIQPGGFSGAGAVRTPQTLAGPTVTSHVNQRPVRPKTTRRPVVARPVPAASAGTAPNAESAAEPAKAR